MSSASIVAFSLTPPASRTQRPIARLAHLLEIQCWAEIKGPVVVLATFFRANPLPSNWHAGRIQVAWRAMVASAQHNMLYVAPSSYDRCAHRYVTGIEWRRG